MPEIDSLGRLPIAVGIAIVIVGGLLLALGRLPLLERLSGASRIQQDGVSCFFPLATSLLLAILQT